MMQRVCGDGVHWDVSTTPPALPLPATLGCSPCSIITVSPLIPPPGWVLPGIGISMMGFAGSPETKQNK